MIFQPRIFQPPPVLTRQRIIAAYTIGAATDALQFLAGPLGWLFADELLDVAAMALTWKVLGFHPLLLPTFALEFLPITDMLPTWTGCVAIVIALRKREQATLQRPPEDGTVIDV